MVKRKSHSASLKARVALSAIKEEKTINELAAAYEVHPQQVKQWKKQLLEGSTELFSQKRSNLQKDQEELTSRLYQQIGQLQVELSWLKKKSELFV